MRGSMHGFQHFILLGVLLAFSFTVSDGPGSVTGRLWWLVGCGFFLLWQPLVSRERRLSLPQVLVVFAAVTILVFWLNWAWLATALVMLASLVGGKVIVARERRLGWYYLLAFAFLCVLLFVWVSPRLYDISLDRASAAWARWLTVSSLASVVLMMPWRRIENEARVFDFLISLLIQLILSSVLMAVGILIAMKHLTYIDALANALIGLGGAVLALNWLWNPRLGFGGIDSMLSRYLLRFGFPFEDWLRRVTDHFDQEEDPEVFLEKALVSFIDLPWVVGGRIERGGSEGDVQIKLNKTFGSEERYRSVLAHGDLRLVLFTTYGWSASMIWQANLLFKLVVEFYRARQRERLLRQLQYVQAVYETGSRVTHDVKNLLQSMETLCFALKDGDSNEHSDEVVDLMRRQLPVISLRLRATLDKLSAPLEEPAETVELSTWWEAVQQRYSSQGIAFAHSVSGAARWVPQNLFDNVLDNLIANALQKRLQAPFLRIAVTLELVGLNVALRVGDDGSPVSESVAANIFYSPVASANGLGIGLFHAGRLALRMGYRLALSENRPGAVTFSLEGPVLTYPGSLPCRG